MCVDNEVGGDSQSPNWLGWAEIEWFTESDSSSSLIDGVGTFLL